jgi:hypothetical protein
LLLLHVQAERVSSIQRGHTAELERLRLAHWQMVEAIKQQNAASRLAARQEWEEACDAARQQNEAEVWHGGSPVSPPAMLRENLDEIA